MDSAALAVAIGRLIITRYMLSESIRERAYTQQIFFDESIDYLRHVVVHRTWYELYYAAGVRAIKFTTVVGSLSQTRRHPDISSTLRTQSQKFATVCQPILHYYVLPRSIIMFATIKHYTNSCVEFSLELMEKT